MPGISLIHKNDLDEQMSMPDLKHEPHFSVSEVFKNHNMKLIFSGYDGYPRCKFQDDEVLIFVEGEIYNKTDLEVEKLLKNIARAYLQSHDHKQEIVNFINACEGDFVVIMCFSNNNELLVFNDRWARLSLYYYHDAEMLLLSRELKFILHHLQNIEFDRVAMAEFLVFEYSLGNKNLIKNVFVLEPSSMLNLRSSDGAKKLIVEQLILVDFQSEPSKLSKEGYVKQYTDLFLQSIQDRINKCRMRNIKITADLSGGYDSRSIFGGLLNIGAKVDLYTDNLITGDERACAEKVASLGNNKINSIYTSFDINERGLCDITFKTDCTVNAFTALTSYQNCLNRIKQVDGPAARFMGWGAEFIRKGYKPGINYKTIVEMIGDKYLIRLINVNHACSILKLNENDFYDHINKYFNKYPESSLQDRLKHMYFEYYSKLVNAGENRHRLHFWTVQPLWAKDLFNFGMICVPSKYHDNDFFVRFLKLLSPNLLNVPIYGSNIKLGSKLSLTLAFWKAKVKPFIHCNRYLVPLKLIKKSLSRIVGKRKKSSEEYEQAKQCLVKSCAESKLLSDFLCKEAINIFIDEDRSYFNLYQLVTLTLYLKELEARYGNKISIK